VLRCCSVIEHRSVVSVQRRSLGRGSSLERTARPATTTAAAATAATTTLARAVVTLGAGSRSTRDRRGRPQLGIELWRLWRVRIPRGTCFAPAVLTSALFAPALLASTLLASTVLAPAILARTFFTPRRRRAVAARTRCSLRGRS